LIFEDFVFESLVLEVLVRTPARLDATRPIEPGRSCRVVYLRAAQAYMLISMPTGTSTILGVFQVIFTSEVIWRKLHAGAEPRSTPDIAQVLAIDD
jgi:hypothetical protein